MATTMVLSLSQSYVEAYQPVQAFATLTNSGSDASVVTASLIIGGSAAVSVPLNYPANSKLVSGSGGTLTPSFEVRLASAGLNASGLPSVSTVSLQVTMDDGSNVAPSNAPTILVVPSSIFAPILPGALRFEACTQSALIAAV